MKRSYIIAPNNVRIACDSIGALVPQQIESEIAGGYKVAIRAAMASGMPVLQECHPHEAEEMLERWTRLVFGGPERKVDNGGLVQ